MPRPKGMPVKTAQKLDRLIGKLDKLPDAARWYVSLGLAGYTKAEADEILFHGHGHAPKRGKSCRRPGEFKPGGGRYEKKTCVPRRKARKPCHKKGQFKPGGGRYETTSCRVTKKRRRARSVRGSAGMSI